MDIIERINIYFICEEYLKINGKSLKYNIKGNVSVFNKIDISNLNLKELPQELKDLGEYSVKGNFKCNGNKLISLKGSPKNVGGDFWCRGNKLTSLEGSPKNVDGIFWCSNNRLTSLKGSPKSVGGFFDCTENKLTSLDGAPKIVDGNFRCSGNTKEFTEEDVRKVSKVKGNIYIK